MEYIIAILVVGVLAYLLFRNKSETPVAAAPLAPYKVEEAAPVVVVEEPAPVVVEAAPVVVEAPAKKPRKPRAAPAAKAPAAKSVAKKPVAKAPVAKAKAAAPAKKPAATKAKSKKV